MILQLFLQIIISVLTIVFSWVPDVSALPFGIDALLVSGIGYYRYIADLIPPLLWMLQGFMWIMGWKVSLWLLRVFRIIK